MFSLFGLDCSNKVMCVLFGLLCESCEESCEGCCWFAGDRLTDRRAYLYIYWVSSSSSITNLIDIDEPDQIHSLLLIIIIIYLLKIL